MTSNKSKQNAHRSQGKTPKAAEIAHKKATFLLELRATSGNVSTALERAKLNRRTAYAHYNNDSKFGEAWREVLEIAGDEVLMEVRRRALGYEETPEGRKPYGRSSDRLLIYLCNKTHFRNKWRGRVMQTATYALEVIEKDGKRLGLSNEQIKHLLEAMVKKYEDVSLD